MTDSLVSDLLDQIPASRVVTDRATRLQWASDASIYYLLPQVVVFPENHAQVQAMLRVATEHETPVTFRAGGTSLSGQAVTDGILAVVSKDWRTLDVQANGQRVACGPGVVGAWVNQALARHQRRIGPDPASMNAAEIGGIVANNASGMCCGVAENSYNTLAGLDLVLADGYHIDTGAADADERLKADRPELVAGLHALAARIQADPQLSQKIRSAFETKNTVGYNLAALIDHASPAKQLQGLVVGSEGTLAFVAGATYHTLPAPSHRATAFLVFTDLDAATSSVGALADAGAAAVELLDSVSLRRVEDKLPDSLPPGEPAALLVEFQKTCADDLDHAVTTIEPLLATFSLASPAEFTRDPARQAAYWTIRKGLFPSVGAVRALGTAVVIEDVTFPVGDLAEGVRALRQSFARHGYDDAVIFGHAKDGNLHFTLTPDLNDSGEVERYDAFLKEMVEVVLSRRGHLKAEHGTGRNMAPWVTAQWGEDAVALMRQIKKLLDPQGILNPGVLLSDDPNAHAQHLKTMPAVHPLVDACIECGFCEPVCPSRDHSLSPRQRIGLLRAAARSEEDRAAVDAVWQSKGLDTCAADGSCAIACPVNINTGDLVKAERARGRGALSNRIAGLSQGSIGAISAVGRVGLLAARLFGGHLPGGRVRLPPPAPALPKVWPVAEDGAPTVVYVPTCLSRTFGPDPIPADLAKLCAAAGVGVVIPAAPKQLCCGQPFASKGFPEQDAASARNWAAAALAATESSGATIAITDTGTCASHLEHVAEHLDDGPRERWNALTHLDPATFCGEVLLPRLQQRGCLAKSTNVLSCHPSCSDQQHGWGSAMHAAVSAVAEATVPDALGCCGMAGDKGWTHPGLTAAATKRELDEVARSEATMGVTTSATCGANLSHQSGMPYRHLFAVLADALTS